MPRRLTYANVVSTLALALAVGGGSAYAASTITSRNIKDGTIQTRDLARKTRKALKGRSGPAGVRGPAGAVGVSGAPGETGARGAAGEPGPAVGPAGGALSGSYPAPGLAVDAVGLDARAAVPQVRLAMATQQPVPTGSATAVAWDVEASDASGFHAPGSPTIAPSIPGCYLVSVTLALTSSYSGTLIMALKLDGGYISQTSAPVASNLIFLGRIAVNATVCVTQAMIDASTNGLSTMVWQNGGSTNHVDPTTVTSFALTYLTKIG